MPYRPKKHIAILLVCLIGLTSISMAPATSLDLTTEPLQQAGMQVRDKMNDHCLTRDGCDTGAECCGDAHCFTRITAVFPVTTFAPQVLAVYIVTSVDQILDSTIVFPLFRPPRARSPHPEYDRATT